MFLIKIEWKDKLCCLKNCQIKTGMKIYLILLRTFALQNRVSKKKWMNEWIGLKKSVRSRTDYFSHQALDRKISRNEIELFLSLN